MFASQTATSPLANVLRQSLASARRFFRFAGFGGCVDRLLLSAGARATHLNASGFGLFTFRQRHAQHAVVVFGSGAFGRNGLGQRERTSERSIGTLDAMIVIVFVRLLKLTFAAQSDDVVLDREIEVILLHAG